MAALFLLGNFTLPVAAASLPPTSPLVISEEFGGQTAAVETPLPPANPGENSGENSFTTLPSGGDLPPSDEGSFTTLPPTPLPPSAPTVSGELSFTTTSGGNGGGTPSAPVVSGEGHFTTLPVSVTPPPAGVSAESSFTTAGPPPPGGPGGPSGPGPVTGGGSGFVSRPGGLALPLPCELYLKKFIKLGAANDPAEVRKLEAFLRVFEGFEIPINGVYELHDFEAVKIFQQRYANAVLAPWGLAVDDPTGYVYITTTLTINQIYCHRTVGNDLDLRSVFPVYGPAASAGEQPIVGLEATTTPTTTPPILDLPGFFQAAAAGLLGFLKDWWCLLLIIILILIVAYLLDERERLRRRLKDQAAQTATVELNWPEPFEEIVVEGEDETADKPEP